MIMFIRKLVEFLYFSLDFVIDKVFYIKFFIFSNGQKQLYCMNKEVIMIKSFQFIFAVKIGEVIGCLNNNLYVIEFYIS